MVYCDSEMVDESGVPLGKRMSLVRGMYSGNDPLFLLATNCASGHAILFRKRVLERALPFPKNMYYDWWLALVATSGRGISYLDEPLVQFRRHDSNVTSFGTSTNSAGNFDLDGFLRERHLILEAMLRLECENRDEIVRLRDAVWSWLHYKRKWPLIGEAWRHRKALTYILRPRSGQIIRQALNYLARRGRRP
jgi:hypothetical protein